MTVKTFEHELVAHRNSFRKFLQKGETRVAMMMYEMMYDLCTNSFEEECVVETFAEVFKEEMVA